MDSLTSLSFDDFDDSIPSRDLQAPCWSTSPFPCSLLSSPIFSSLLFSSPLLSSLLPLSPLFLLSLFSEMRNRMGGRAFIYFPPLPYPPFPPFFWPSAAFSLPRADVRRERFLALESTRERTLPERSLLKKSAPRASFLRRERSLLSTPCNTPEKAGSVFYSAGSALPMRSQNTLARSAFWERVREGGGRSPVTLVLSCLFSLDALP